MSLFRSLQHRSRQRSLGSFHYPLHSLLPSFQCARQDEYVSYGDAGMPVPPFGCSFSAAADIPHVLAVTNEEGIVRLYDTQCQDTQRIVLKDWQAHTNAVFDVAWMPGEHKLVTASGDQTAKLFDVKAGEFLGEFKGHQCSLKSVAFPKFGKAVFSTGGRDGNVMVWDIRCSKKDGVYRQVNQINGAHNVPDKQTPLKMKRKKPTARGLAPSVDSHQSVTVVIFQDDNLIISAGAVDGVIKVWDLRKNYTAYRQDPTPARSFPYPGNSARKLGYSSLALDATGSSLFASCTDDNIYMFNVTGLKTDPVSVFSGHQNSSFYIKSSLSPDGQFLLSGSSDHSAYIWQVSNPQAPPVILQGHSQEVTSVTWCPSDFTKIATCSDDNNVRIWRLQRGCKENEEDRLNYVGWANPKKSDCSVTGSRICTPAKSIPAPSRHVMSSPVQAPCAPSYTGDLPMSSCTPTSPFLRIPKVETPKRQKAGLSTSSPKPMSTSKVSIKDWVTRTPKSQSASPVAEMKTPSPRKAFTPVEQYLSTTSSRTSPVIEKKAKRRLDTSTNKEEHECFGDCDCVTELEPGLKKARVDLCYLEECVDVRCLSLADLGKDREKVSAPEPNVETPEKRLPVGSPCHSRAVQNNKENSSPDKNWLSALGHKLKSDKSTTPNKVTSSPSSRGGSGKKVSVRNITSSPIPAAAIPGSTRKISMYFHKKPTE